MKKILIAVFLSILTYEVRTDTKIFPLVGTDELAEQHLNHNHHSSVVEHHTLSEEDLDAPRHHRVRRQFVDLSLNHDKNGRPRPLGVPHGILNVNGSGNRKNHNINLNAGLGAVVWRSRNDRHSVGVGASFDQNRGRIQGSSVTTKPKIGVGVGYKFKFG
ncbi:hypothetical protein FHG87_000010 [Trinorchestia longiramus]|nr:hypothetical protein FHG87_000010 [Trinorchestia longiramus]